MPEELRAAHVGLDEARTSKVALDHSCAVQVGPVQVRPLQVAPEQPGVLESGPDQPGAREVSVGEREAAQVGSREVGAGEGEGARVRAGGTRSSPDLRTAKRGGSEVTGRELDHQPRVAEVGLSQDAVEEPDVVHARPGEDAEGEVATLEVDAIEADFSEVDPLQLEARDPAEPSRAEAQRVADEAGGGARPEGRHGLAHLLVLQHPSQELQDLVREQGVLHRRAAVRTHLVPEVPRREVLEERLVHEPVRPVVGPVEERARPDVVLEVIHRGRALDLEEAPHALGDLAVVQGGFAPLEQLERQLLDEEQALLRAQQAPHRALLPLPSDPGVGVDLVQPRHVQRVELLRQLRERLDDHVQEHRPRGEVAQPRGAVDPSAKSAPVGGLRPAQRGVLLQERVDPVRVEGLDRDDLEGRAVLPVASALERRALVGVGVLGGDPKDRPDLAGVGEVAGPAGDEHLAVEARQLGQEVEVAGAGPRVHVHRHLVETVQQEHESPRSEEALERIVVHLAPAPGWSGSPPGVLARRRTGGWRIARAARAAAGVPLPRGRSGVARRGDGRAAGRRRTCRCRSHPGAGAAPAFGREPTADALVGDRRSGVRVPHSLPSGDAFESSWDRHRSPRGSAAPRMCAGGRSARSPRPSHGGRVPGRPAAPATPQSSGTRSPSARRSRRRRREPDVRDEVGLVDLAQP